MFACTVLIDFSNAFDCVPHGRLIAKLNANGFTNGACEFTSRYLIGRFQRVKLLAHLENCSIKNIIHMLSKIDAPQMILSQNQCPQTVLVKNRCSPINPPPQTVKYERLLTYTDPDSFC